MDGLLRARIRHHESMVLSTHGKRPRLLSCVNQNVGFHVPTMKNPALLRSTLLWSMHKQRLYTPLEHFQVQGYPIFEDEPLRASFADAVMSLTDTEQRSVAGNGMHASCAGLAMMFLLACSHPMQA